MNNDHATTFNILSRYETLVKSQTTEKRERDIFLVKHVHAHCTLYNLKISEIHFLFSDFQFSFSEMQFMILEIHFLFLKFKLHFLKFILAF